MISTYQEYCILLMEAAMSLQIRLECPRCNALLPLDLTEFSPGRRQICTHCQTPARMTPATLERFTSDLRQYCQA